jgi:uncharacterized protein
MLIRLIIICVFLLLIEIYSFQAIKTVIKVKWMLVVYQIVSFLLLVFIVYSFSTFDRRVGQTHQSMITMGLFLVVFVPKIMVSFFLLIEDVVRLFVGIIQFFVDNSTKNSFFPVRRKFVSQIALGLAAIPLVSLIYGIFEGKYNFKVLKPIINFPDLPEAFNGFKILQISDIHSGSFDNKEKIEYAINLINEQQADLILFTGDIVNTFATEMHPWIDTFNKIKNFEYGKFSVLGNHDYGEYLDWPTQAAKDKNFEDIKKLYGQIGFNLLLNEHRFIEKEGQKIAIVGVENWGKGFKQAGDLKKASQNLSASDFKILMSHDPSHWEYEVKNDPKHFQLTLSGHTHGFQFGIEIPGWIKWSPVSFVYKQWAGLYENLNRFVYVNRGFGFHAYPGRVGIWPEITVITLKKG